MLELRIPYNFVILLGKRGASFLRIFDRQNVPASDISKNRPIWDLDFNERKVDQSLRERIDAFLTTLYCPFSEHERF